MSDLRAGSVANGRLNWRPLVLPSSWNDPMSVWTQNRNLELAENTGVNCLTSFTLVANINIPPKSELNKSTKLKDWIYISTLIQSIVVLN